MNAPKAKNVSLSTTREGSPVLDLEKKKEVLNICHEEPHSIVIVTERKSSASKNEQDWLPLGKTRLGVEKFKGKRLTGYFASSDGKVGKVFTAEAVLSIEIKDCPKQNCREVLIYFQG